ncbi:myeloid leukemia factor isoform X2 [Drosophila kikkawai]|uniref:Myeloid leukemia factor isoform X2 n=1 Tax=Drosophila kikkawai TaxID=30033 RepID=A0A6P4JCP2_DROKI|nr:myeloid leukemia factor isoform X2 [Drosophila kikkawai]
MSLFGALMGDFDDDLGLMNNHMNHTMNAMNMQMRSMNRLMSSFMPDPFMQGSPFDPGFQQSALMERPQMPAMPAMGLFGMPMMPNFNRLLNADIGANPGASFCQSTVMTMSSGPDGRPQIYQASTSTKTGPGGVRETRKTVQDSRTGVKKMAIGHHIGERAHIIEKEQDMRSGQLEERQEFINLEEEEAEQFDREFTSRATRGAVQPGHRGGSGMQAIMPARPAAHSSSTLTIEPVEDDDEDDDCVIQEQQQPLPMRSVAGRHLPSAPAAGPHSSSSSMAAPAATATSSPAIYDLTNGHNHNNNNNYVSSRRSYLRNGHGQHGLATPRRPLRTPPSSPLATVSSGSHSFAASPSIHPHPYAAHGSAHSRRQQRGMKQHHQYAEEDPEVATSKATKRSKKH